MLTLSEKRKSTYRIGWKSGRRHTCCRNYELFQIKYEECKAFDVKPKGQELQLKFGGVKITIGV